METENAKEAEAAEIGKALDDILGEFCAVVDQATEWIEPPTIKQNVRTWCIYTADLRTGRVQVAMEDLKKAYAMELVRRWNASRTDCVLIAWPEWMPGFTMEIIDIKAAVESSEAVG